MSPRGDEFVVLIGHTSCKSAGVGVGVGWRRWPVRSSGHIRVASIDRTSSKVTSAIISPRLLFPGS